MGRTRLLHDDVFRRLCRARALIQEQPGEPLTVAQLAAAAGLSPFHFLRTFREAFQRTPHQYLQRVRIERAKELLQRGDLSVTDVCFEVGFSSLGSFGALFAREVGTAPGRWRRDMHRLVQVPGWVQRVVVPHCFFAQLGPAPLLAA